VATASFSYTGGTSSAPVLITEAGVPSASPLLSTRVFLDYSSASDSGVAVVNPGGSDITINADLRSSFGTTLASATVALPANTHTSLYTSQLFPGMPNPFIGTLALSCSSPFVATNIVKGINGRHEELYYALPVADLNAPPLAGSDLAFSEIVDGGGMRTEFLLMNPSDTLPSVGTISIFDSNGAPLELDFGSLLGPQSSIDFTLSPGGAAKFATLGSGLPTIGHATISVPSGPLPIGSAVFLFWNNSQLVSQVGIPSSPQTTSSRLYVETASSPRYRNTGIALANTSFVQANVLLKLTGLDGSVHTSNLTIGPNSQVTRFVTELFPDSVPADFSGLLDVSSDMSLALSTLRMTINERNEVIFSTLPVADLANPPHGEQYLPQFLSGGGFDTTVILINSSNQGGSVYLTILDDRGKALDATVFK